MQREGHFNCLKKRYEMTENRCIICGCELVLEQEKNNKVCNSCYVSEVCPEAILGGN